jgi:hypothetical protein
MTGELPGHTNRLPANGKWITAGKWEGDTAGRMAMLFSVTRERSVTQLECDQQFLSIGLAGRRSAAGTVFGNSYDVGHGSYPR